MTRGVDELRIFWRVPISCPLPVKLGISKRHFISAFRTPAALKSMLHCFQLRAFGRLPALIVGQFLVDLAAESKEQLGVSAREILQAEARLSEERVRLFQFSGRECAVAHVCQGSLPT